MRLSQYMEHLSGVLARTRPEQDPEISGPAVEDSRQVVHGSIFVARAGGSADGHRFIGAAADAGAVAVFGTRPVNAVDSTVPYIQVADGPLALAELAASYYGFPARQLTVIGVTGTDGKTSTSNLIYSIMKEAGIAAGMISTIKAVLGNREAETGLHVTTPSSPEVHGYLREMVDNGLTHCVLEATSHGLAQRRVGMVDFDVAVVTNIQHEHLDFHGTWENYRDAKGLLFDALTKGARKPGVPKLAVINRDDANSYGYLLGKAADTQLAYGVDQGDYHVTDLSFDTDRTRFTLHTSDGSSTRIETALVGRFNISNILAAAAATYALGVSLDAIAAGVAALAVIPGRMERIDEGQDFLAVVDFAHTPNALKNALEAARVMIEPPGRVIAVWGSAGLRDPGKRTLMGEVSAELADITIITAEDPRTENLEAIMAQSLRAAVSRGAVEGGTVFLVPDRGEAIYRACQMTGPADIVIACGKGHEQSMCFGETEYPWDDRDAMRAALRGEPLRTLPTAR